MDNKMTEPRPRKKLFSKIKWRFPKKKRRKNRYKVGYEDLVSDSCSLPSICEFEEFSLDDAELALKTDFLELTESQERKNYLNLGKYNDDFLTKDHSPGQDSAYGTNSSIYSQCENTLIMEDITETIPSDETDSLGEISPHPTDTDSESLGEISPHLTDTDSESLGEVSPHDSISISSLSTGEYHMPSSPSPQSLSNDEELELCSCKDVPYYLSLPGRTLDDPASSCFMSPSPSPAGNFEVCQFTEEASPLDYLKDRKVVANDITLNNSALFSALKSKTKQLYTKELTYFESSSLRSPVVMSTLSDRLEEQVCQISPNIFESARSRSTSPSSEEHTAFSDEESVVLVDEIDAYNLTRSVTPSVSVTAPTTYIDTSVSVFPQGQNHNYLLNKLLKVASLFNPRFNSLESDSDTPDTRVGGPDSGLSNAGSDTTSEEVLVDYQRLKLDEDYSADEGYSDLCSEITDSSTLCPVHSSSSSQLSVDTLRGNRLTDCNCDLYDTEIYDSQLSDTSDDVFLSDQESVLSERTRFYNEISWAEERFIELPKPLQNMWGDDSEFFDIIKFLGKWGKYHVIIDGTLDVSDFWEDHVYFDSAAQHSETLRSDQLDTNVDNQIEEGGAEHPEEETNSEVESKLVVADCPVVDRLFSEFCNKRLLQFNPLQQKSLFCGRCKTFHIIEII